MSDDAVRDATAPGRSECPNCRVAVEYVPATSVLRCPRCGLQRWVEPPARPIREHPYAELARLPRKPTGLVGVYAFRCGNCGAQTQGNVAPDRCHFCGVPLVAATGVDRQIVPEAVLPFTVDREGMRAALRQWMSSRWFAPSALKRIAEPGSMRGTYLPYWTFDARTVSNYRGARGRHYWTSEMYTDSQGNRQTRQVQQTTWSRASGAVSRDFDDVLVDAAWQLPLLGTTGDLGPWPLALALPYQADYLAGYQVLRYTVEPEAGLVTAKARMAEVITQDCRRNIGGDAQRVHSVETNYSGITYKLILLPVWMAGYVHRGRTWQVWINGRTGKVVGQRPYSPLKIAATVVGSVLGLVGLVLGMIAFLRAVT